MEKLLRTLSRKVCGSRPTMIRFMIGACECEVKLHSSMISKIKCSLNVKSQILKVHFDDIQKSCLSFHKISRKFKKKLRARATIFRFKK